MAAKQEFASRFAKHKDELEWLFMELYRVPGRGKSGRSGWRVSHPGGCFRLAGRCGAGAVSGAAGAPLKGAAMDIVTIGEVLIDLAPPAPLRWMLSSAPKS